MKNIKSLASAALLPSNNGFNFPIISLNNLGLIDDSWSFERYTLRIINFYHQMIFTNQTLENISDDFGFVKQLFDLIVEEELYPEHLNDVVEDYLLENYSERKQLIKKIIPSYIA